MTVLVELLPFQNSFLGITLVSVSDSSSWEQGCMHVHTYIRSYNKNIQKKLNFTVCLAFFLVTPDIITGRLEPIVLKNLPIVPS